MFILLPLFCILIFVWLISGKKKYGKLILTICIALFSFILVIQLIVFATSKVTLDKEDYYGNYVVNRSFFPGKQANWQHKHFRFTIKENDSVYFYVTDGKQIIKTYKGTISTVKPGISERLIIHMNQPTHHIFSSNPTTYRSTSGFYLVFHSPHFNNVFFIKE